MKWKILQPIINLMFKASDEKMLNTLYEQAINMCKDNNSSVIFLIKLIEKKVH